ncbi:hypothetical protein BN1708_018848, partial [Verticillium longisporum]
KGEDQDARAAGAAGRQPDGAHGGSRRHPGPQRRRQVDSDQASRRRDKADLRHGDAASTAEAGVLLPARGRGAAGDGPRRRVVDGSVAADQRGGGRARRRRTARPARIARAARSHGVRRAPDQALGRAARAVRARQAPLEMPAVPHPRRGDDASGLRDGHGHARGAL